VQRVFPRPLIACIAEGRSPHLNEFDDLATRIVRESFANIASGKAKRLADLIADAAFHGRRTFR